MPIGDKSMIGYTQCFKIITGKIVPINLFAKIITESENNSNNNLEIDNID
uniref:Uncharacterized protein n=1 Tax=Moumouvirus sp. 'Monve' TaxID=1128131 RepID=H2ECX8_9VIRU|nr:hypothetical protein mv_L46 [Moumouvirus Monve]